MKEYEFIIGNEKYQINDENDLELILKLFYINSNSISMIHDQIPRNDCMVYDPSKISSIIHWNIIMEIDEDLENIIVSYKGLLNCLRYLNEKNTFLLLIKIGDKLTKVINNSHNLGELLAKIPDESNKMRLLNQIRTKGLIEILRDASDLGNILEWIYGKNQRDFLDLLGHEIVKNIFLSTNEIIMILHYLNDENKDYLMDIISFDGIKQKIKTNENLLIIFRGLTNNKAKDLIKIYKKNELLSFFKNEEEFYNFMLRLPLDKEKIFLKFLTK